MLNYGITLHPYCPPSALTHALKTPVSIMCRSSHNDVTLIQTLHGKGSTNCGNSDSTLHRIISHSGREIFVLINRILTKIRR